MSENEHSNIEEIKTDCTQSPNTDDKSEVLDKLAEKQKFEAQIIANIHSGPLPSPQDLVMYNQIIPDGANRIMCMAEKEQEVRMELERKQLEAHIAFAHSTLKRGMIGQTLAFGVVLCFCALSGFLIYEKQYDLAVRAVGLTMVAVVGLFLPGKWIKNKNKKSNPQSD